MVTAAQLPEREGAKRVFGALTGSGKKLRRVWVDSGYSGPKLQDWLVQQLRLEVETARRVPKSSSCCRTAG